MPGVDAQFGESHFPYAWQRLGDKALTGMIIRALAMVIAAAEIGLGLALVLLFFKKHAAWMSISWTC